MAWIIVKASRPDATVPYAGVTCDVAGIERGLYYESKAEADAHAQAMSERNAVGFIVKEIPDRAGGDA